MNCLTHWKIDFYDMTEKQRQYAREYYRNNKDKFKRDTQAITEYMKEYRATKMGRAGMLLQRYKARDREKGRGECDFDAKWIVENILSKPCAHCGETDWHKIGCNRLDNSKPHTKDNVEPCCGKCNIQLGWSRNF